MMKDVELLEIKIMKIKKGYDHYLILIKILNFLLIFYRVFQYKLWYMKHIHDMDS